MWIINSTPMSIWMQTLHIASGNQLTPKGIRINSIAYPTKQLFELFLQTMCALQRNTGF